MRHRDRAGHGRSLCGETKQHLLPIASRYLRASTLDKERASVLLTSASGTPPGDRIRARIERRYREGQSATPTSIEHNCAKKEDARVDPRAHAPDERIQDKVEPNRFLKWLDSLPRREASRCPCTPDGHAVPRLSPGSREQKDRVATRRHSCEGRRSLVCDLIGERRHRQGVARWRGRCCRRALREHDDERGAKRESANSLACVGTAKHDGGYQPPG